jgi:hypothetical protein
MIGNYAGAALGEVAESDFSSGLDGMAGSTIAEIPCQATEDAGGRKGLDEVMREL